MEFTVAQQGSAKEAIYQAFIDAGINVNINNDCYSHGTYVGCRVDLLECEVNHLGSVSCDYDSAVQRCNVLADSRAYCSGR